MLHKAIFFLVASLASVSLALPSPAVPNSQVRRGWVPSPSGTVSITGHVQYGSSIGVLGCKINTNRVAYWPYAVDCNNICVRLTNTTTGITVTLLRIDESGGAHDISYDAWNYLLTGNPATPGTAVPGGGFDVQYEYINPDDPECKALITDPEGKLPLMAANSVNYVTECNRQPDSWVARNYQFWNINDANCKEGWNDKCTLPPPKDGNQPKCPDGRELGYGIGIPVVLGPGDHKVKNIAYMTGEEVEA
ncbi:hypothetical protein B0T20DRAFT_137894 [Sordaria brevicollis]|uniref:Uncharacterized protein n=1 Tax=Sordaria brevicollis TaxID=83679 RepID=A0AAE0UGB7_SORBR|nr:hypothetical protein B0T20DRAFT_137894 [Sordaria brevicollis]